MFEKNLDLTRAQKWLDISKAVERNYWNISLEARMLVKDGKKKAAIKLMEKSIIIGQAMSQLPFNLGDMEALLAKWKGK